MHLIAEKNESIKMTLFSGLFLFTVCVGAQATSWAGDSVRFSVPFEASNLPSDVQSVKVFCLLRKRQGESLTPVQGASSRDFSVDNQGNVSGTATIVVTPSARSATRFVPTPDNYLCSLHATLNDGETCRVGEARHYPSGDRDYRCASQSGNSYYTMGDF